MGEQVGGLAPWEVSPDEGYWRSLLEEGEYGVQGAQGVTEPGVLAPSRMVDVEEMEDAPQSTATEAASWEVFARYQDEDQTIDLPVVGFNRGGLLVRWHDVVGFVPASQLCDGVSSGDDQARKEAFASLVGRTLTLKAIEVDRAQGRLILSERASRRVQEPDLSVLDRLAAGEVCRGRVTNLCSFGVFVDLGGVEGLIHISELSWGRVAHPSDVLQSGQETDVYVLSVDRERGRVALSLKRLFPDPWESAESRYGIGQVVAGMVTNVVNFGAFVRLEEGLEGLIHNSECADSTVREAVREGDTVYVRVISLDRDRHRMGLSLERVAEGGTF